MTNLRNCLKPILAVLTPSILMASFWLLLLLVMHLRYPPHAEAPANPPAQMSGAAVYRNAMIGKSRPAEMP